MTGELILQTKNLGKQYKSRWAVHHLDLEVYRGDVFGFLGPNGAGKSTTIRMLLSLIRPTEGEVVLFGKSLEKEREKALMSIGGIVEKPDFYSYLSARRNLEIVGALNGGVSRTRIGEVLELVGLASRASDKVKTYSHGMKQRLGIAEALLANPECVILDEPTSGLDPQGMKEIRDLIRHLASDQNKTVMLSSHLLNEVELVANRMAVINRGELVTQGEVAALLEKGEKVVSVQGTPAEKIRSVLSSHGGIGKVVEQGESFEVTMPFEGVPELARSLVREGVNVQALVPRRSLEEYFLSITETDANREEGEQLMILLVYYELVKTFLKKRTYIGFALVAVIVPLVEVAMKLEGGRFLQHSLRSLQQDFFFVGNLFNGWFVAHNMMNSLWVHVPLLITFVAGDQLAGEATAGTYRLILVRPVSRTRIFLSKLSATVIYTVVFVGFMAVLSIGLSLILLGGGDLMVLTRGILVLPQSDVAWRFVAGYALAAWAMVTIASISLFFSSFVENAVGPIISTMGLNMVFLLVTVIPLELFQDIKPYLFTNYMNVWQKVFEDPIPWDSVWTSSAVLGAYSVGFVLAAWFIFRRKDILS